MNVFVPLLAMGAVAATVFGIGNHTEQQMQEIYNQGEKVSLVCKDGSRPSNVVVVATNPVENTNETFVFYYYQTTDGNIGDGECVLKGE